MDRRNFLRLGLKTTGAIVAAPVFAKQLLENLPEKQWEAVMDPTPREHRPVKMFVGDRNPEGIVKAQAGCMYERRDGPDTFMYIYDGKHWEKLNGSS